MSTEEGLREAMLDAMGLKTDLTTLRPELVANVDAKLSVAREELQQMKATRENLRKLKLADAEGASASDAPGDEPESTIGGQTTCIVCFVHPKSHMAVPCSHQCVCASCAASLSECPYCRAPVQLWMQPRMV